MGSTCKNLLFYSLSLFLILVCTRTNARAADSYYYQLKIYHLKTKAQEDRLDQYLEKAYLPAMHRMGVKNIGVFKPVESDTSGVRVYVLTPFRKWDQLENVG
ncbi:MAG TPA: hypothetical protein VGI43_11085, partial [Mucilaginibacter sp.]